MNNLGFIQKTAIIVSRTRDQIDEKLLAIKDYLESTGFGYKKPLVDNEGFPYPDIDHVKILSERQRASRMINDRKRITNLMDNLTNSDQSPLYSLMNAHHPFAIATEVRQKSPAENSGLMDGDLVISFGKAHSLHQIKSEIIEFQAVEINVIRCEGSECQVISLEITPRPWEGDGLVGCLLLPLL